MAPTPQKIFLLMTFASFGISIWLLAKSRKSEGYTLVPRWDTMKGYFTSEYGDIANRLQMEKLDGLPQDDPFLIRYLRQFHVYPPSDKAYRYSTLDDTRQYFINESRQVTQIIQAYLKNMTNGIFVEAGANNGANELSNTLVLERDYGWTGLLVEGSPLVFPKLVAAHRKAWKSDLLLSKSNQTKLAVFKQGPNLYAGKPTNDTPESIGEEAPVAVFAKDGKTALFTFELLTVPLYSLVAACKFRIIDYLSLDVEGTELEILENFPFDKVLIRTMIVEVMVLGRIQNKTEQLVTFLEGKGYVQHPDQPTPRDLIFIHGSVMAAQEG